MLLSDEATNAEYIYIEILVKKILYYPKNEAWKKKLKSKYV